MTTQVVDPVAFVSPASSLETLTTVTVRAPDPGPAEANPLSVLEPARVERRWFV